MIRGANIGLTKSLPTITVTHLITILPNLPNCNNLVIDNCVWEGEDNCRRWSDAHTPRPWHTIALLNIVCMNCTPLRNFGLFVTSAEHLLLQNLDLPCPAQTSGRKHTALHSDEYCVSVQSVTLGDIFDLAFPGIPPVAKGVQRLEVENFSPYILPAINSYVLQWRSTLTVCRIQCSEQCVLKRESSSLELLHANC